MKFEKTSFKNSTVELDGKHFVDCTFNGCRLVFAAVSPVRMSGCTFGNCSWHFTEAAALTLGFMASLYKVGGLGPQILEATFENIRGKNTGKGFTLN